MDSNRNYKFAFVSNSAELGELVKCYADPSTEDLVIKLATMEEAVSVAREFLDEGVEVILGGGGTGSLLARTLGQPIVKIARTYADIVRALIKAKKYGSYIGLTSFATPTDGIEIFEELLSIKIRQIVFNTTEELINGISVAFDEGVKCIVGGGVCKKIITSLGGVGIIVLPSKSVILQALREARAIASVRRREQEDVAQLRTILETIKEGVIVIDKGGKVKIFNQMAADIFGTELKERLGEPLPNVIKGTGLLKVEKEADEKGVELFVNLIECPLKINTQKNLLKPAIFHVIRNAIEATPKGGRVTVATLRKNEKVILTISDTGSGIPEACIDKIFDPFFSTKEHRFGMGLPLVKQVVLEHMGEIKVESEAGKGTTFNMIFPIRWLEKKTG